MRLETSSYREVSHRLLLEGAEMAFYTYVSEQQHKNLRANHPLLEPSMFRPFLSVHDTDYIPAYIFQAHAAAYAAEHAQKTNLDVGKYVPIRWRMTVDEMKWFVDENYVQFSIEQPGVAADPAFRQLDSTADGQVPADASAGSGRIVARFHVRLFRPRQALIYPLSPDNPVWEPALPPPPPPPPPAAATVADRR